MDYKQKYGGVEVAIPGFRCSRHALVSLARSVAPTGMRAKQAIVGRTSRGLRDAISRLTHGSPVVEEVNPGDRVEGAAR